MLRNRIGTGGDIYTNIPGKRNLGNHTLTRHIQINARQVASYLQSVLCQWNNHQSNHQRQLWFLFGRQFLLVSQLADQLGKCLLTYYTSTQLGMLWLGGKPRYLRLASYTDTDAQVCKKGLICVWYLEQNRIE